MERKDWLLLLLGQLGEGESSPQPVDRVRAMKALFVLGEHFTEIKKGSYYEFTPYNYGPFDPCVYDDALELINAGQAEEVLAGGHRAYRATPAGVDAARRLAADRHEEAAYLLRVRTWANSVSFSTLLKAIYQKWPQMRANSVFVG